MGILDIFKSSDVLFVINTVILHMRSLGIQGNNYGEEWKSQRTTTMKLLTRLGFGKEQSRITIHNEAERLIGHLKGLEGQSTDPTNVINLVVSNVVNKMVFGETYAVEDEEFKNVVDSVFLLAELFSKNEDEVYNFFPGKSKEYKSNLKRIKAAGEIVNGFINAKIKEHKDILDITREPQDFIDAYLTEFKKAKENATGDTAAVITEDWLLNIIQDLMGAGYESTAVSLRWLLLYMLTYPDVMFRVQEEADAVCGNEKLFPDHSDRTKMPYTMAVIYEVLRHASVAHFSLPHETMGDVELGEFFIPKNTEVIMKSKL